MRCRGRVRRYLHESLPQTFQTASTHADRSAAVCACSSRTARQACVHLLRPPLLSTAVPVHPRTHAAADARSCH